MNLIEKSNSSYQIFFCTCKHVQLLKHQVLSHLFSSENHNIYKIPKDKIVTEKDFQTSVLSKIQVLLKIQIEISQSSTNLIKIITKNTNILIERIDKLIKIYKKSLINPKEHNIKYFQQSIILNTFKVNFCLISGLNEFFKQKILAIGIDPNAIKKNVKDRVSLVFKDSFQSFSCITAFKSTKYFALGTWDGAIQIWNAKSLTQEYSFFKHEKKITSISVGTNDEFLLSGYTDSILRLWNLKTKKHHCKLKGHLGSVLTVIITRDNKKGYSFCNKNFICIWDFELKSIIRKFEVFIGCNEIHLIQNDKILVSVGEIINFWDNVNILKTVVSKNKSINTARFSSDEKFLAAGMKNGIIEIYSTSNFSPKFEYKVHSESVLKIEFSKNLKQIISSCKEKLVIWDTENSILSQCLELKISHSFCLLQISKSFIIYYTEFTRLHSFNINELKKENEIHTYIVDYPPVAISNNLKYVVNFNGKINIFNTEIVKTSVFHYEETDCLSLSISLNSVYLICGYKSGNVLIINLPRAENYKLIEISDNPIQYATISSDANYIGYIINENSLKIKCLQNNKVLFDDSDTDIRNAMFCHYDKMFVYVSKNTNIKILDKNFSKVYTLDFLTRIVCILICEDNTSIVIKSKKRKYSCYNLKKLNSEFFNQKIAFFKSWCGNKNSMKAIIFKCLKRISF